MLKPVKSHEIIAEVAARRNTVVTGPDDFSDVWLNRGQRVALPEEAPAHLDSDHCQRLARALSPMGVNELVAITNDPLIDDDEVSELTAHEDDLAAFSWEFSGLGTLLLPRNGVELAVLCSVDDYHLVAGPRAFVTGYAGDLHAARSEYLEYIDLHFDFMQPVLRNAAKYMDWIEDGA